MKSNWNYPTTVWAEENRINLDQLSKIALQDLLTAINTNYKKITIDDMKILYEHSISGKLF